MRRRYVQSPDGRLREVGVYHRALGPPGTVMDIDDIKADCDRHRREREAREKRDRLDALVRAYEQVTGR